VELAERRRGKRPQVIGRGVTTGGAVVILGKGRVVFGRDSLFRASCPTPIHNWRGKNDSGIRRSPSPGSYTDTNWLTDGSGGGQVPPLPRKKHTEARQDQRHKEERSEGTEGGKSAAAQRERRDIKVSRLR